MAKLTATQKDDAAIRSRELCTVSRNITASLMTLDIKQLQNLNSPTINEAIDFLEQAQRAIWNAIAEEKYEQRS